MARASRDRRPARPGWSALLVDPGFARDGGFPIAAYSEAMPGPWVGRKPSGADDPLTRPPGDEHGWRISIYDEVEHLVPGLTAAARAVAAVLRRGQHGRRGLSADQVRGNPYCPAALLAAGPALTRRPLVGALSVSLSRTQDDKGRVRWTLFGASERGPAAGFWNSFRTAPDRELPARDGVAHLRAALADLIAPGGGPGGRRGERRGDPVRALIADGVRVLPAGRDPDHDWGDEPLPAWLAPAVIGERAPLRGVRVLITFRAFARLPAQVRRAYLDGSLELFPSPHTLVFFGHAGYRRLAGELPFAMQIPLLRALPGQHVAVTGLRVPQSGWLDEEREPHRGPTTHGPIVDRVKRTHRWNRTRPDRDERDQITWDDDVSRVLFSTAPAVVGLYDKPMARNAQVWSEEYRLILDGATASRATLDEAAAGVAAGGRFGYRFHWPPMRVGRHDVYWQRPVVFGDAPGGTGGDARVDATGLRGWLVGYDRARPVAHLWPRVDDPVDHADVLAAFGHGSRHEARHDLRKLIEAGALLGQPLDRDLARRLVGAKLSSLDRWLRGLPGRAADRRAAARLVSTVRGLLAPARPGPSRTLASTATRDFERRYWDTIARLATGAWDTKNNADPVGGRGAARDLDRLADWLAAQHAAAIARHGLTGRAVVGHHRFRWTTDFDFPWMHGWARSQTDGAAERNVVVVIPGRDRSRAIVLADHYDTAYMEDVFDGRARVAGRRRTGTRRAAAGADDNHSATACLLLAADVLLPLAAAGRLAHDVWLVHLTGEEFPGDCLGARHLVQRLVERNLAIELAGGGLYPLRDVDVAGALVLDMIAHNLERDPYVFQIAPGEGAAAMALAARAQRANQRWNRGAPQWNRRDRRGARPYRRRARGTRVPDVAPHPIMHGEVRPSWHWSSTVFNTDAQIFSDAGLPVVLLMEHYDIDRSGYHDTHDTLANIDLDYGAALAAIAIETVADAVLDEEAQ